MSTSATQPEARALASLRKAIEQTVTHFLEAPFDFLYESDLRSALHQRACELFVRERVPLRVHDPKRWHAGNPTINPVKSEYPSGLRFDIAVLPDVLDPTRNAWNQPVRAAVEIKLWQPDGTGNDFRGDTAKLESYRATCREAGRPFSGVTLLFLHPGAEWRISDLSRAPADISLPGDGCAAYLISRCEQTSRIVVREGTECGVERDHC